MHYKVADETYSKEDIKLAYNTYYQKEIAFETLLQFYINFAAGNTDG